MCSVVNGGEWENDDGRGGGGKKARKSETAEKKNWYNVIFLSEVFQPHNSIVNVFIVVAVALCTVSIYFILQIFLSRSFRLSTGFLMILLSFYFMSMPLVEGTEETSCCCCWRRWWWCFRCFLNYYISSSPHSSHSFNFSVMHVVYVVSVSRSSSLWLRLLLLLLLLETSFKLKSRGKRNKIKIYDTKMKYFPDSTFRDHHKINGI